MHYVCIIIDVALTLFKVFSCHISSITLSRCRCSEAKNVSRAQLCSYFSSCAGASDEDAYSPRDQQQQPGLPPRPPSARSRDKSPRSATPSRCNTPSSGHHSAASKLSASSKSPGSAEAGNGGGGGGGDSILGRLRREVDALKRKLHSTEREWNEVSWHSCKKNRRKLNQLIFSL